MKLYDFSFYSHRRKEGKATEAVLEVLPAMGSPNSVPALKKLVIDWLELHKAIINQVQE